MNSKEGITHLTSKFQMAPGMGQLRERDKQKLTKDALVDSLSRFIREHFDELPLNIIEGEREEIYGNRVYELHVDLASNLVPVTLNFPGKQIKAYISKDTAKELGLSRDIESIVLKGED